MYKFRPNVFWKTAVQTDPSRPPLLENDRKFLTLLPLDPLDFRPRKFEYLSRRLQSAVLYDSVTRYHLRVFGSVAKHFQGKPAYSSKIEKRTENLFSCKFIHALNWFLV